MTGDLASMVELKKYLERENIEFYLDHSIKPYLTMGIGGTVPLIAVIDRDSILKELLIRLQRGGNRFILVGGGSNVIFPDGLADPGLVVIVNRAAEIVKEDGFIVRVNSGASNMELMEWCCKHNAGGIDFLAGVPGTVGGAAAVNAGAFGSSISTALLKAEIFSSDGRIITVDNDYFEFQYRNSIFKYGKEVIINVFLQYYEEDGAEIKKLVQQRIAYRQEKHPAFGQRSAGCFFKNPVIDGEKTSAGKLIQQSGCKGRIYKSLQVADAHSNFIINRGSASFSDIKELETEILRQVAREKGVALEREVIYISPDGEKY